MQQVGIEPGSPRKPKVLSTTPLQVGDKVIESVHVEKISSC
ncbi:hypothetical protein Hanom_Chr07g00618611 [Helianthus anomalus]